MSGGSSPPPDPRVYFAAERTLLAWVRTGIAVMAFGFVVARFGLFLELAPAAGAELPAPDVSAFLGAALVVLGIVSTAAGALQYRRYAATIRPDDLPSPHASRLPQVFAWSLVALGGLLVVVLLL